MTQVYNVILRPTALGCRDSHRTRSVVLLPLHGDTGVLVDFNYHRVGVRREVDSRDQIDLLESLTTCLFSCRAFGVIPTIVRS